MSFSREDIPAMFGLSWWEVYDFPLRIFDQDFGSGLSESDFHLISVKDGYRVRERTQTAMDASGKSYVKNAPEEFLIMLDVHGFEPGEVKAKVVDNWIVVDGKHAEREDEHGFVEREFSRRYMLPGGVNTRNLDLVKKDDCISLIALKEIPQPLEYEVPITTPEQPRKRKIEQ